MSIENYANRTPVLNLKDYFNGTVHAWGIVYDFFGKAGIRFQLLINATWEGDVGTLEEDFTYSDGRQKHRTWTIHLIDEHNFKATAPDVVGEGKGAQYGNAANTHYVLKITRENGKAITLCMDDWLYLIDEKTVINRVKMRKWGITVGELNITFRK